MSPSLSSASCPAQLVVGSMCPRVHLSLSAPASSRFPSYPVSFPFGKLVGSSGLEPPTSRLSGVRSNHLSYAPMFLGLFTCYPHNPFPESCGGDEEDRTPDPLRARQMLSQLSYTPKSLLRESLSEPSKLNNILLRPSTPRIQESTLLSPAAFSP